MGEEVGVFLRRGAGKGMTSKAYGPCGIIAILLFIIGQGLP